MAQPLSPHDLVYGLVSAAGPRISPDGSRIVYTRGSIDPDTHRSSSQLWVRDREGGNARQITQTGNSQSAACWSPDGKLLAFVSDRVKKPAKSGIFVLPADEPGEASLLTAHGQGISHLAWSPDGNYLVYSTTFDPDNPEEKELEDDDPPPIHVTERLDYKLDGIGWRGEVRLQAWIVDLAGGERRMLTSEPRDHVLPTWSPDGKSIALIQSGPAEEGTRLKIFDVATGHETPVGAEEGMNGAFAWSPSGDRILFAEDPNYTTQPDFYLYDVASGTSRQLTTDLPVLLTYGMPGNDPVIVWLDDNRALFAAFERGGSAIYTIDTLDGTLERKRWWDARHLGLSVDKDRRWAVQVRNAIQSTGELVVTNLTSGESRAITRHNDGFFSERLPAGWERFDVDRGDFSIEAWLLTPPDFDPAKRYPLVLDIHGGPHNFYGYDWVSWHQCLATHGFLVVYCNPRGSSTYGRRFVTQVFEDWGGKDYLDLMAVVDKVLERPYADPKRTGMMGYSYGGYMTSWILGQTSRFKACVCGAPCFDLNSFYGTSDVGYNFGRREFGSKPHERHEWYNAHSPSEFVHRATTPTLVVQGEADDRCPVGQGEQLFVALKKAGCETALARFPGGSHLMILNGPPSLREDYNGLILDWFRDHLGGPR